MPTLPSPAPALAYNQPTHHATACQSMHSQERDPCPQACPHLALPKPSCVATACRGQQACC
jgi:hypothetical protein